MHPVAFFDLALRAWRSFSPQAAAIALTALWQSAAVAGGLALCLRLAPRSAAAQRFALWAAAFGALVGLQFFPVAARLIAIPTAGATQAASLTSSLTPGPWIKLDASWSLLIAALWGAASAYRATDLALHSLRLRKLWRSATPVELDGSLTPLADAGHMRGRGRRAARICTTDDLERPGVIGFLSPRILIPGWLYARLTPGELEQIVLHEAEHLRRGDDWTNLLQKLCLVLFPLNPALVWIERRLCREREMACDDGVIRITHAPRAYAACLTTLAERGLERGLARRAEALSLGVWQRRPELAHRVHSVLRRRRSLSPAAARIALGAVGCGLVFGSVELARCPQLFAFVQPRSATVAPTLASETARNTPPRPLDLRVATRVAERKAPLVSAKAARAFVAARRFERHAADARGAMAEERDFAAGSKPLDQDAPPLAATRAELAAAFAPDEILPHASEGKISAPKAGDEPAQDRAQQQSWIVFTTWEQVQIPASAMTARANARGNAPVEAVEAIAPAGKSRAQTPSSKTRQITVTRLLLRIYSTDSRGRQHASAELEGGWLVIQL